MNTLRSCADPNGSAIVNGDRGQSKPGYLGLILDKDRREVRREGYPNVIKIRGHIPWQILEALFNRQDCYCSTGDLLKDVWELDGRDPEDTTIWSTISHLRTLLRPLGVKIERLRDIGYRLMSQDAT